MQIFASLILLLTLWVAESHSFEGLINWSFEDAEFTSGTEKSFDDLRNQFSPRILVSGDSENRIDTSKLPVDLAKNWLRALGLYHLESQILQAKHMKGKKGTLLFELKNPLQAIRVVETWRHSPKEGSLVGLSADQTEIDFFSDFPKSQFD